MLRVKVTLIGNSLGILIPKEALSKLKAERGDTLYLAESQEASMKQLSFADADYAQTRRQTRRAQHHGQVTR